MTASEFNYLKAIEELSSKGEEVKLTDVANKMMFAKPSVYRAVEKLVATGYIMRNKNKSISLIDKGKAALEEYLVCIRFIAKSIAKNWNISPQIAYMDAVNTVCIISNASRLAILNHLNKIK
ncbi:MAG: hypothetical protein WC292_02210 [Clostridia bacterium]